MLPSGVMVPRSYPVASKADIRRRQRELVDAQQRPQLGPGDLPVAGDQGEQETAVLVLDHERLHDIRGPDPQDTGRLLEAAGGEAFDDLHVQPPRRGVGEEPFAAAGCFLLWHRVKPS